MSTEEIQQEIQAQVEFKMNELLTGMKNRIIFERQSAFVAVFAGDFVQSAKNTNYAEAYQIFMEAIKKEMHMGTPCPFMHQERKREAKDKAVSAIMNKLNERLRGKLDSPSIHSLTKTVVNAIENAQV